MTGEVHRPPPVGMTPVSFSIQRTPSPCPALSPAPWPVASSSLCCDSSSHPSSNHEHPRKHNHRATLWLITWRVSDHCNVGFLRNIMSFFLRMTIVWRTSIALRLTFKFFNLDAKTYWSFRRWKYWSLVLFPCVWKPHFTDFLWPYNFWCHRSSRNLSNSTVGCHIVQGLTLLELPPWSAALWGFSKVT